MKLRPLFAALLMAAPLLAQQSPQRPAEHYFGDIELVNQDGKSMRLYNDLMKDKVIVINSFFASCTGSCPVMSKSLATLQSRFADHLGRDLVLVSITVDPKHDTPAQLHAYAERWKARPGWYFLTGSKEKVDAALKKLGQYVDAPSDHLNIVVIGNERTGLWKKAFGLAPSEELAKVVESVLNDRG
jgi:protein SCO1/2